MKSTLIALTIIILLTFIKCGNTMPVTGHHGAQTTITTTTGRLYGLEPGIGSHHGLQRRDITSIGKDDNRYIRLYQDDKSPPLDMVVGQESVLTRESIVAVRWGNNRVQVPTHEMDMDCFLHGHLLSHDGNLSINRCGTLSVKLIVSGQRYELEEMAPQTLEDESEVFIWVKVTKISTDDSNASDDYLEEDDVYLEELEAAEIVKQIDTIARRKRDMEKGVTIEVALFADANFMKHLSISKGASTASLAIQWFVFKWNLIQDVYSDVRKVGFQANIKLKKVELWWENPTLYPGDNKLEKERLRWFCENTPEGDRADQKVLYTKSTGGPASGLAYVNTTCRRPFNCYLVKSPSDDVFVELHEMGHSLGLSHDDKMKDCRKPSGFMGRIKTRRFKDCYRRFLVTNIRSFDCLYRNDFDNQQITPFTMQ